MREQIVKILDEIEVKENVKILYACESGSRAWGFDSPDSDWDIRFIYLRPTEKYHTVYPIDYTSLTLDRNNSTCISSKISNDLDFAGHDIQKALYLISKGNPDIISWLHSSIVYKSTSVVEQIKDLAEKFFNTKSGIYHYVHMAGRNFSQYIVNKGSEPVRLKKYLYVLRPIICCMYIANFGKAPPSKFDDALNAVEFEINTDTLFEIKKLINLKKSGVELGTGESNPILNEFCNFMIGYYEFTDYRPTGPNSKNWMELDELFNTLLNGGIHGTHFFPCKTR